MKTLTFVKETFFGGDWKAKWVNKNYINCIKEKVISYTPYYIYS